MPGSKFYIVPADSSLTVRLTLLPLMSNYARTLSSGKARFPIIIIEKVSEFPTLISYIP